MLFDVVRGFAVAWRAGMSACPFRGGQIGDMPLKLLGHGAVDRQVARIDRRHAVQAAGEEEAEGEAT